jgi:predicted unusual protein kinase regulating ubiquinone biosynthesis (AarF/ABC1/UbiB family)
MLDLGSVRTFEEPIRRAYLDLARSLLAGDDEGMRSCFVRLGFLDVEDDPVPMIRIMRLVFEPALVDTEYDPRQYQSVERAMEVAQIAFEHRMFKSPGHRVFLARALVGLESYVQQLGTVTNWRRVFAECVARAERPGRRAKS